MIRPLYVAAGLVGIAALSPAVAQAQEDSRGVVNADVVSFRNAQPHLFPRMDVYVSVPYQLLQFTQQDGTYISEYRLRIEVRDTTGKTYIDSSYTKTVLETKYSVTRGSTGTTDKTLKRFTLPPNSYVIDITVTDAFGQRTFQVTKNHRVVDYDEELPSMSSILFVSDIEQRGSRYSIIPYIGDVVWSNDQRLFAFFEYYSASAARQISTTPTSGVAFSWQLLSENLRIGAAGMTEPVPSGSSTTQHFFPITVPQRLLPGTYSLVVRAHSVSSDGDIDTTVTLASTQRKYRIPRTVSNDILVDLKASVKQLIYVAGQSTIDSMLAAKSDGERLSMFEEFWRGLDPTPATATNEALEEYYQRIKTANARFKSYNEGWLTDMGRVYIIYGEPLTIERTLGPNRISVYARWTYGNGVVVTFEDPSGFGDFRLRTGLPGNPKYDYNRSSR